MRAPREPAHAGSRVGPGVPRGLAHIVFIALIDTAVQRRGDETVGHRQRAARPMSRTARPIYQRLEAPRTLKMEFSPCVTSLNRSAPPYPAPCRRLPRGPQLTKGIGGNAEIFMRTKQGAARGWGSRQGFWEGGECREGVRGGRREDNTKKHAEADTCRQNGTDSGHNPGQSCINL